MCCSCEKTGVWNSQLFKARWPSFCTTPESGVSDTAGKESGDSSSTKHGPGGRGRKMGERSGNDGGEPPAPRQLQEAAVPQPCGWPPGPQSTCQRPGCISTWPESRCIFFQVDGAHVGRGDQQDCMCQNCRWGRTTRRGWQTKQRPIEDAEQVGHNEASGHAEAG